MKTPRVLPALCALFIAGAALPAQDAVPTPPPPAPAVLRTAQEIEQLVGPIALYPDALIALILPASTAPADIVLAARYLRDFPSDRSQIEHRAWDESVKSLTHYAEVVKWMDDNLQWTKQLGEAFAEQPTDVMQAVQRLRAKARAAGTLVDTPQQQVLAEPQVIRIVPAQPDVIYVPHYEPEIVFVDRPVYQPRPFVTFGMGVAVGSWLAFDCDWHRHTIWAGNRHRRWTGHDWRRPVVPIAPVVHVHNHGRPPDVRPWRPAVQPPRSSVTVSWQSRPTVVRPSPFGTSTARSYTPRSHASDGRRDHRDHRDPTPQPAANPLSRTFTPPPQEDLPGPRATSSAPAAASPLPRARLVNPAPPVAHNAPAAPSTTTPPAARPSGNYNGNRGDRESRPRPSQSANVSNAPSAPSAPSLPMANIPRSAPVTGPVSTPAARAYSQSRAHPAPAAAPSLPMAAPVRGSPVGPTAPAAAPAQNAPARSEPSDDRRGRRNEQIHEH